MLQLCWLDNVLWMRGCVEIASPQSLFGIRIAYLSPIIFVYYPLLYLFQNIRKRVPLLCPLLLVVLLET